MKEAFNGIFRRITFPVLFLLGMILFPCLTGAKENGRKLKSVQVDGSSSKRQDHCAAGRRGMTSFARKHSKFRGESTSTVFVQFRAGVAGGDARRLLSAYEKIVVFAPDRRHAGRFVLSMSSVEDAAQIVEDLSASDKVVWADVNYRQERRPKFLPADSNFTNQWYLHNTGQSLCMTNRDVCAERAWDITLGTSTVVVAVLDDGCDLTHPDLVANVFINSGEYGGGKESNGIDDDGNGYEDDWRGWNFVEGNNNPSPVDTNDNHGTAMAGLIAASVNNGTTGVVGIAADCRFLPIRVAGVSVTSSNWADAIEYAAQFADVIAISYYLNPDDVIYNAFDYALVFGRGGKGCVICCALGNDGILRRYTTDAATAPEALTVGSCSSYDKRPWFGDYGPSLNIVCPGGGTGSDVSRLITTDRTGANGYSAGDYTWVIGTSYANALAAGAAALVITRYPSLRGLEARRILESTCDKIDADALPYNESGWNERYGFGRINAYAALTATQSVWDIYEPDDTAESAAWIADAEIQYRSLSSSADFDWARIAITSSTAQIRFTVLGTTGTWLRLYDSGTNLIAQDGWGFPGYSYLTRTLSTGTYFVRVESSNNAAIPCYGLHYAMLNMTDSYEDDNTKPSAGTILPREMQYRTLYPSGDVDWVAFTLPGAAAVDIRTMGELDGYLELSLWDGGGMIGYDYRTNSTAYISTQLVAGTYWLKVNDISGYEISSYQLLLETFSTDLYEIDDSTNDAPVIRSGEQLLHTIYPTGDMDYVQFVLTNTANVLILTDTINPLMSQTVGDTIITLYRENGGLQFIQQNDDGNNRDFSAIYRAGLDPGVYYVRITGYTNTVCADYYISLDVFEQAAVLEGFSSTTNGMQMMWQGDAAFTYQVQYSSNLVDTQSWAVATNFEGRAGMHYWTDDGSTTVPGPDLATRRFYRVMAK